MIASLERKTPKQAASDFYYWSKLLAGKLIVNIVVYADESGTHNLAAKERGSNVAVLAGFSGFADDWVNFCGRWQIALNKFHVPVFHFSEFADKINRSNDPKWPYYGCSKEKRHEFLFGLASIAGSRARFPFAASFHLSDYHAHPTAKTELRTMGLTDQQINGSYLVYFALFHDFFEVFFKELEIHHPNFNDSISFVFERKDSDGFWRTAADLAFDDFAKKNPKLKLIAPTFGDSWNFVPLQAADMIAYRVHQIWENEYKTKKSQVLTELDLCLFGNFKGKEDFKDYLRKLLGRELREVKE